MSAIFSPDHDRARAACPTSAKEDARSVGGLDAEGKGDLSSRLNDGLHVTDEELMRRTPLTKPSPSPSMSFSLGTTPGKQYPSRYSLRFRAGAVRSSGRLLVARPMIGATSAPVGWEHVELHTVPMSNSARER